ncbi:FadR/GntR family transcriptional regulator [Microbacterium sp. No. 7]|uniref:FadR/GntR family transcriptional regulator n=1 Tax=Microbacterium sp. No. 7 TaxID=1714373 RepID=UPI0006D20DBF|nr:FCD domain-containing protein [Microbacterium sp. No. 7]ALJ21123.1 hypothetical protein AOA12_14910 [Microbacterium sp. No. 7]
MTTDPGQDEPDFEVEIVPDETLRYYLSMLSEREAMELAALDALAREQRPVGSARLAKTWASYGIVRGQATAGRFLDHLETQGYSRGAGVKVGRIITRAGLDRRNAQIRFLNRRRLSREIIRAADASVVTELIDLLHARRGLETEAARLAVERAGDEEIQGLLDAAHEHLRHVEDGGPVAEGTSHGFHLSIVELSHNEVILSTLRLLIEGVDPKLQATLQVATERMKATVTQAREHLEILHAMLDRDAERAAALVHHHFTELIALSASLTSDETADPPAAPPRASNERI